MSPADKARITRRARKWKTKAAAYLGTTPRTLADYLAMAEREGVPATLCRERLATNARDFLNITERAFRRRHREGEHMAAYWRGKVVEYLEGARVAKRILAELQTC